MELLVVTVARTQTERDPETAARVRMVEETIRHAPGLVNVHSYQSRGKENYYALVSSWDDEESWQKAQERHNPKRLLAQTAARELVGEPEQWFLHYLWGYTRPAVSPNIVAIQLTTVRPDKIEQAQQLWLKSLGQQVEEGMLAYAFFARGVHEDHIRGPRMGLSGTKGTKEGAYMQGVVLLNFFAWGNERERTAFYRAAIYQKTSAFVNSVSASRIFSLEPCL